MDNSNGSLSGSCPAESPQFAYCCFHSNKESSTVSGSRVSSFKYGILLRDRLQEVSMAIVTSYQTLPSLGHVEGLYFRVVDQEKEYNVAELLSSSSVELLTCCGDRHSLWKNTKRHVGSICPRKGDFAVLLLKSEIAGEILSQLDGKFRVAGLLDCMSLEEIQKVVHVHARTIPVSVCREGDAGDLELEIDCASLQYPASSLDDRVQNYCHSYMKLSFLAQSSQQTHGLGLPIVYRQPHVNHCKLFGIHIYLESQSAAYGVLLVHIIDLLRSHKPTSFPYCGRTYRDIQLSYIPPLAMLVQSAHDDFYDCALCHYKNLHCFLVEHHEKLPPDEHLLLLECLVRKKLLFARASDLKDDLAIKIYSLKIISVICGFFASSDDELLMEVLVPLQQKGRLSIERVEEMVRILCDKLSYIIDDKPEVELAVVGFKCWEKLTCLKGIAAPHIYQRLPIIKRCLSCYDEDVDILTSYGNIMEACFSTMMKQVQLLREQKPSAHYVTELHQRVHELQQRVQEQRDMQWRMSDQHSAALSANKDSAQLCLLQAQKISRQDEEIKELKMQLNQTERPYPVDVQSTASPDYFYQSSYHKLKQMKSFASVGTYGNGRDSHAVHEYSSAASRQGSDQSYVNDSLQPSQRPSLSAMHSDSKDSFISGGPESSLSKSLDAMSLSGGWSSFSSPVSDIGRPVLHTRNSQDYNSVQTHVPLGQNIPQGPSINQPLKIRRIDINPEHEAKYKHIVTANMAVFVESIHVDELLPLLTEHLLVTNEEAQEIMSEATKEAKARFLFYKILPSKGDTAYSRLAKCINEERKHLGHVRLQQLFQEGLADDNN